MEDSKAQTVFIVDGYGLIFREYYAFAKRPLTNAAGENISAVHGFFNNLALTLRSFRPSMLAVALDSRGPTFRHEMFPEYKANRSPAPDDLKAQFPWIESLLAELGVPALRVDGFEADDVIATLARKFAADGKEVSVLSSDKDLLQLVGGNVRVMRPGKADKSKIWEAVDERTVAEEWGVPPSLVGDLLALTGDTSDNVPGVRGVGAKTAVKLLSQYGSLDGVYEHAGEIKGALGGKVRGDRESAYFSRRLVALREDVPLGSLDEASLCVEGFRYANMAEKCRAFSLSRVAALFDELSEGAFSLEAAEPEVVRNSGDYSALTDADALEAAVLAAVSAGAVALDTETDSLDTRTANLIGFSLSWEEGRGVYVPLSSPDRPSECVPRNAALAALARLFRSPVQIVMHNAKFDAEVLFCGGLADFLDCGSQDCGRPVVSGSADPADAQLDLFSEEPPDSPEPARLPPAPDETERLGLLFSSGAEIRDTMLAAWVLSPDGAEGGRKPFSLEELAERRLRVRGVEFGDVVPKGGTFADVPLAEAAAYCAEDADFTLRLHRLLSAEVEEAGLSAILKEEIALIPVLAKMELRGIHVEPSVLADYSAELSGSLGSLAQKIYAAAGHEFNIASTRQLGAVLFDEMGLKGRRNAKTGVYYTDEDSLRALGDVPVVADVLDWRGKSKLLSTYVEALPLLADENSRVHTSFVQTGTATGRLSSRNPNLQNIPVRTEEGRRIRRAFTAAPGMTLVSADYAQIELVVLAHLSGDANLRRAFEEGVDVHRSTASLIYGVPMESVTAEQRRSAKTINFGIMYGMGAYSLASDLGIGYREAEEFIRSYFAVYSGVREFFERTVRGAEDTLFTTTISGRRREIRGIAGANARTREAAVRVAKNSPIQGSAADIVKRAMLDVDDALSRNPTGARLLLQVHDELIFECPDDGEAVSDTVALVRDKMEHAWRLSVPLRVSIESGRNWGEFH